MPLLTFGDIAVLKQGANLRRHVSDSQSGTQLGVIQVSNIAPGGISGPFEKQFFSEGKLGGLFARAGDVLLAQAASNLTASLVGTDHTDLVVGSNIAIITIEAASVSPDYVASLLNTESARLHLQRRASGVGTQHVSLGEIRRVRLPFPSRSTQDAFVRLFRSGISSRRAAEDLVEAQGMRVELAAVGFWRETLSRP